MSTTLVAAAVAAVVAVRATVRWCQATARALNTCASWRADVDEHDVPLDAPLEPVTDWPPSRPHGVPT